MTDRITVDSVDYVRAYPVAEGRCPHCGAGPRAWTPAQVIARLRKAGPTVTAEEWNGPPTHDRPTFSTVRRMFGTWNNALRAAGLAPHSTGSAVYWTRELVIEAILAWAREHGRQPSCDDWAKAAPDHPTARQVAQRFGSWNAAIDAAGFFPRTHWGNRAPGFRGEEAPDGFVDAAIIAEHLPADGEIAGLAEIAGLDQSYLEKIRRGRIRRVRLSYADRIAVALDRPDILAPEREAA